MKNKPGSELFIVDNSDSEWKVLNYLHEWSDIAHSFDVATGYFESIGLIRSTRPTPRPCVMEKKTLSDIRAKVERHIQNTYFKSVQAPIGVKAKLKAWMEIS